MSEQTGEGRKPGELSRLLDILTPLFDGKAFAIDQACVAAIHYGHCFNGMRDFSFAMIREDYENLLPSIVSSVITAGFKVSMAVNERGSSLLPLFLSIELKCPPKEVLFDSVDIYPLDGLPVQKTLRFHVFKKVKRFFRRSSHERLVAFSNASGNEFEYVSKHFSKYNGYDTGFYANLVSPEKEKGKTVFQRSIAYDDMFPVRAIAFEGASIPVSKKVENWTSEMTSKRKGIISIVQGKNLECLEAVDRACGEMNLNYFLVGGSLLGAVRNNGFIPWDDDSDIGMLRSDYKRFCRQCEKKLGNGYFLQLPRSDRHSHFVYARVRMNGIEYVSNYNEDKRFHKGIWVDVFPFDIRPSSEVLAKIQRKLASFFAYKSMHFRRKREYVIADFACGINDLPLEDRIYLRIYKAFSLFFPVALCRVGYHIAARFFNPFSKWTREPVYASFVPSYTTLSNSELFPLRKVPYSKSKMYIPNDANSFLARQYGDYLSLPPIHECCAMHGFKYLIDSHGSHIEF